MTRALWLALGSLGAGAGAILAGVGLIATAGYLIARAAERPPILDLVLLFVAVRFFGLTRPALRYLERLASHDLMFRILKAVRGWFVGALLPLSQGQLAAFRSGDLLSRLAGDVDALQESYLRVIAPTLIAVLVSGIAAVGFALVDLRIAAVVLVLLLAYGVGWSWIAYRQSRAMGSRRNDVRRDFGADLVAVLQGSDDVLASGYEQRALDRFAALQHRLDEVEARDGRTLSVQAAAGATFTMVAAWTVLALSLDAVAAGQMPAIWIAPLMLATIASFESVEGLPAAWQFAVQTRDSAARVLEVVRTPPAVSEVAHPLELGTGAPSVRLDGVTFGYGTAPVLRDVSLRIAPGQHVAIVGPTGAGKSTLLSLLMRSWDPATGTICLNDTDLRNLDLDALRSRIAVLPQQVHVFNDSLRENTRLARRAAPDQDVRRALSRAGLDAFVARAGEGLETRLGELGARMSAGERQRLGLARVLLSSATLVLADEPTANLDARAERDVLMTLHDWARQRTLLIVSHRRAALDFADRVVTVADGRLTVSR